MFLNLLRVALLILILSPIASAGTIYRYTYTGNSFTGIYGTPGVNTSDNLIITFDLPSPLVAGSARGYHPTSWLFQAGSFNLSSSEPIYMYNFEFWLNNQGEIYWWLVNALPDPWISFPIFHSYNKDLYTVYDLFQHSNGNYAETNNNPGSWSVSILSTVPEPSMLTLLGIGLGAIGIAAWRKRK